MWFVRPQNAREAKVDSNYNYNYNYVDIIGDELSKSIYRLLVYCLHGDEVIAETSPEVS